MGISHSAADRELLNALVGLTAAFRRHFRRALEIDRFLSDTTYAKEVVDWLVRQNDPALAQTTQFLRGRIHGAGAVAATQAPGPAVPAPPSASVPGEPAPTDSGASRRYVKGLR